MTAKGINGFVIDRSQLKRFLRDHMSCGPGDAGRERVWGDGLRDLATCAGGCNWKGEVAVRFQSLHVSKSQASTRTYESTYTIDDGGYDSKEFVCTSTCRQLTSNSRKMKIWSCLYIVPWICGLTRKNDSPPNWTVISRGRKDVGAQGDINETDNGRKESQE